MHVVVIGAGAAGLVSAREFKRASADVTILEREDTIGGVWRYTDAVDEDLTGASGKSVYCSLYRSLHTNLPRDLMAFSDYTFDSAGGGEDNLPRFPHHPAVLTYLQRFAEDFDLIPHIRPETSVVSLSGGDGNWQVTTDRGEVLAADIIVVANTHYSKPRCASLPGVEHFSGRLLHSHNYRAPETFTDEVVALWGTASSGADISLEISGQAKTTYWCGNIFDANAPVLNGRTCLPSPTHFNESGELCFENSPPLAIDTFIFCTGYHYEFPFLGEGQVVAMDEDWVHPLYHDIVPVSDPSIGFIGLPYQVIPFPLFEYQARWFCGQATGRFELPDEAARLAATETRYRDLAGTYPMQRHFHKLGPAQFDYCDMLASEAGLTPVPDWFRQTHAAADRIRKADPLHFRKKPLPAIGPTTC